MLIREFLPQDISAVKNFADRLVGLVLVSVFAFSAARVCPGETGSESDRRAIHGVLVAQQTAANLHVVPGDAVTVHRPGLPDAKVAAIKALQAKGVKLGASAGKN